MTDNVTVSDETLGKIYGALAQANEANEISIYALTREDFVKYAKRAFVPQTEEPTRLLALVEDSTGEQYISVTDDMDEPARWAARDDGRFEQWSSLVQPVLVITGGVSKGSLEHWTDLAKEKQAWNTPADPAPAAEPTPEPTPAPYAVPFEQRGDGKDL